jgi:hypothetical protein
MTYCPIMPVPFIGQGNHLPYPVPPSVGTGQGGRRPPSGGLVYIPGAVYCPIPHGSAATHPRVYRTMARARNGNHVPFTVIPSPFTLPHGHSRLPPGRLRVQSFPNCNHHPRPSSYVRHSSASTIQSGLFILISRSRFDQFLFRF